MPRRLRREANNPSAVEDENKRAEDFDTEDSVLDALGDAGCTVVPKGKKRKSGWEDFPPDQSEHEAWLDQEHNRGQHETEIHPDCPGCHRQGKQEEEMYGPFDSYTGSKKADVSTPPGSTPPSGEKTSTPPGAIVPPAEGGASTPPENQIPPHETAQPFTGYEGVETGNAAVDAQTQYEIQQGIGAEQARQMGLQRQQEALKQQHQEGWAPQNMFQIRGRWISDERVAGYLTPEVPLQTQLPETPRGPERRQEPRRWTDTDEAGYQRELQERKQMGYSQGEAARIFDPRQEDRRQQPERRELDPITCKACGTGQLVGNACNNCGTTVQELLDRPSSRDSSFESSVRESLERYDHGFVSQACVERAKKLLS